MVKNNLNDVGIGEIIWDYRRQTEKGTIEYNRTSCDCRGTILENDERGDMEGKKTKWGKKGTEENIWLYEGLS